MVFEIAVGDWSDDGHGKCHYYKVDTNNKSIEDIREDYFTIKEKTGIDIANICRGYEECLIEEDVIDDLMRQGYMVDHIELYIDTIEIAKIVVFMLNKVSNSEYKLQEESTPMLQFYGFDSKGRHLRVGGYGLF